MNKVGKMGPRTARWFTGVSAWVMVFGVCRMNTYASDASLTLQGASGNGKPMGMLDIIFLFLFLTAAPFLLIMVIGFTRTVIVLSFLRNALGTQRSPPNQVLVGLALLLTMFIMQPVFSEINTTAYEPYKAETMTREEVFDVAQKPMKEFMLKQTEKKSLDLFLSTSRTELPETNNQEDYMQLGLSVIIPSFILSELNKAFTAGFLVLIPFLIIDAVVSSMLILMDMAVLPSMMIALPFKIMMFVLADDWNLVIKTLTQGFR